MPLKAAFIFLSPSADARRDRTSIPTQDVELMVVGARDYAEAETAARDLVAGGVVAIELCGGFGTEGTARVARAVLGKVPVGVVRFDAHPGLGFKSGDQVFAAMGTEP